MTAVDELVLKLSQEDQLQIVVQRSYGSFFLTAISPGFHLLNCHITLEGGGKNTHQLGFCVTKNCVQSWPEPFYDFF